MSFSDYTDYVAMWRRYPMAIIYNALPSVDTFLFLRFELCSSILHLTIIIFERLEFSTAELYAYNMKNLNRLSESSFCKGYLMLDQMIAYALIFVSVVFSSHYSSRKTWPGKGGSTQWATTYTATYDLQFHFLL